MLYLAIKHIYPEIPDSDFSLQDDGAGPYIKTWSYSQPKPSQTEITAALSYVTSVESDAEWNAGVDAQLMAADLKIIRALTEGDTARINAHKTAQAALRATRR
jgi:hypothetical protein